jgi:hypothetical protein
LKFFFCDFILFIYYKGKGERYPADSIAVLENWFLNTKKNKVPMQEKQELARCTNLTTRQVSYWIHNRSKKEKLKDKVIIEKRNRLGKKNKNILLNYFKETNKSPGKIEICLLARNTGLSEKKIKYWFDQKRTAN